MTSSDAGSASPVSVRTALPRAIIWRGESASTLLDASSGESASTISSYQRISCTRMRYRATKTALPTVEIDVCRLSHLHPLDKYRFGYGLILYAISSYLETALYRDRTHRGRDAGDFAHCRALR